MTNHTDISLTYWQCSKTEYTGRAQLHQQKHQKLWADLRAEKQHACHLSEHAHDAYANELIDFFPPFLKESESS